MSEFSKLGGFPKFVFSMLRCSPWSSASQTMCSFAWLSLSSLSACRIQVETCQKSDELHNMSKHDTIHSYVGMRL